MISINKITLEYKSTVLFGIAALMLSFLVGIIAGVTWNVIVLRSVVLAIVFGVLGYGICAIFKRYVPELYQILTSAAIIPAAHDEPEVAAAVPEQGEVKTAAAIEEEMEPLRTDEPAGEPFKEFDKEGFDRYSSSGAGINTAAGKLGKHILEKEKLAKYEPKIMAQAVRTMMSKE